MVNAGGPNCDASFDAPESEAWLDLHYVDVGPPPEWVRWHFNGVRFFEAQARAQRLFWEEFADAR